MWKNKLIYPFNLSRITTTLLISGVILFVANASFSKEIPAKPIKQAGSITSPQQVSQQDIDALKKDLIKISSQEESQMPDTKAQQVEAQKDQTQQSQNMTGNVQKVATLDSSCLVAPGDNLSITIFGEPDLSQTDVVVRADGNVTINPVGEIKVAGLTISELNSVVSGQLKQYLVDPKISIKLNNQKIAKVYIHGAVEKPGLYEHMLSPTYDPISGRTVSTSPDLTVASVISKSGGILYNADLRHVKITNRGSGNSHTADLMQLIANGDSSQDVFLQSGDSVYVPTLTTDAQIPDDEFKLIASSSLAPSTFSVKVTGEVAKPGILALTANNPEISAAIAAAEGFTPDAERNVVKIQRATPRGNITTIYVNPQTQNYVLRPNDLVFVEAKAGAKLARTFGPMADFFFPFARFAESYNGWAGMFDPTRGN